MGVEGRRIELGFCPQCHHTQEESDGLHMPVRCTHCGMFLRLLTGRFRLLEQLNEGNYAWIYRAHDLATESLEERAIKIMKPGMLDEVTEKLRFQREIHVTRLLSQETPHIVKVFDSSGYDQGFGHFYVMEMLRGVSLDELLMDGVPLGAALTFHLVRQICKALAVAHRFGVIHRDLKPENIFLSKAGGEPYFVKLIDFGIAKYTHTHHRYLTQEVVGTPLYMSPEQCMNQPLDGRADIYALGVLIYRCLTGQIPFVLEGVAQQSFRKRMIMIMRAHIHSPPRLLREARPDMHFSAALEHAVMRAMAKEPAMRYAKIEEMCEAISSATTSMKSAHQEQ